MVLVKVFKAKRSLEQIEQLDASIKEIKRTFKYKGCSFHSHPTIVNIRYIEELKEIELFINACCHNYRDTVDKEVKKILRKYLKPEDVRNIHSPYTEGKKVSG